MARRNKGPSKPRRIQLRDLHFVPEPLLEFAHGQHAEHPRDGLALYGPIAEPGTPGVIHYGVIGTAEGIRRHLAWSQTVAGVIPRFVPKLNPNALHHITFLGFEATFNAKWPLQPTARIQIDDDVIKASIHIGNRNEAIKKTVDLFVNALVAHADREETTPQVWFVVVPEVVYALGRPNQIVPKSERTPGSVTVSRQRAARLVQEPTLFGIEDEESEVYKFGLDFRRQLKARLLSHRIVTQLVRETTLTPNEFRNERGFYIRPVEDPATLAWKLCTTTFYKAGGQPWRLANVRPGVCYVGLVFKETDPNGDSANACCAAQMFLSSGDGVVFRGALGPWYTPSSKEFHLDRKAAGGLISMVIEEYRAKHGHAPKELFIHGRARFDKAEWEGFQEAAPPETKLVCVQIRSARSDLKLFRRGQYPVIRGTALKLNKRSANLWTSGYVPRLDTYIGPETPNPLFVRIDWGDCDLDVVLKDVMGLTKINFNTCLFNDGVPVTIRFANAVGDVLVAAPMQDSPKLPFKFYI
jgi:hypothetical protein